MKVQDLLKDVFKLVSVDNKEEMLCYLKIEQDLIKDYNDFIIGWYKYKNNIYILCSDKTGDDLTINTYRSNIKNHEDADNIAWELKIDDTKFSTLYAHTLPSILMEKIITILPKELKIDVKKAVDDYIKKVYDEMGYNGYIKDKTDKRQKSIDFVYGLLNHYNKDEKKDLSLPFLAGDMYYDLFYALDILNEQTYIYFYYQDRGYYLNIHKDYNNVIHDYLFSFSVQRNIEVNEDKIEIYTPLKEQTVDGLVKTINELLAKEQAIIKCLSKDFL